jgi:hypothetical protein
MFEYMYILNSLVESLFTALWFVVLSKADLLPVMYVKFSPDEEEEF